MSATANSTPLIYRAPEVQSLEHVEDLLFAAFAQIREALASDRPVVVVVHDEDLLGHRSIEQAAVAGGLLGLTRAFATEGVKPGWRINAIAITDSVTAQELDVWTAHVGAQSSASGAVLRLGSLHLGRVPV